MAGSTGLRAVKDGEAPPTPPPKKSITEAAASGTYLELLVAVQDRLAKAVQSEGTSPRDLAALTKRLQDVNAEIRSERTRLVEEANESGSVPDEAFDASTA